MLRWRWRDNALAYVLGVGIASALADVVTLIKQPLTEARLAGLMTLTVALFLVAMTALRARSAREVPAQA